MHTEPVTLQHQTLLQDKLFQLNLEFTDYSFGSIYLFRNKYHYELLFRDDDLFIKGKTKDGKTVIAPTKPINELPTGLVDEMMYTADMWFPIPHKWLGFFDTSKYTNNFSSAEKDYICLTKKIQTYAGRNLSPKRNLVKQFLEAHTPEVKLLTEVTKADAHVVLEIWQSQNNFEKEKNDYYACQEAINLVEALHFKGYIYYVEGKPAGLVIGEAINSTMYDLHFVKADKSYKGLYQYILEAFAQSLDPSYTFLNFEQDLGIPALAQSKSSYEPDHFGVKFRVFAR